MGRKHNTGSDSAESKKLVDKPKPKPKSKERTQEYLAYKRYIKSEKFKEVRDACFTRDDNTCQFCGWSPDNPEEKELRVLTCHHKSYKHIGLGLPYELKDVITCCNTCHKALHDVPMNMQRFNSKKIKGKPHNETYPSNTKEAE